MEMKTAPDTACGIPSERDAALADQAGQVLEVLLEGTQLVSARFDDETVDLQTSTVRLLLVVDHKPYVSIRRRLRSADMRVPSLMMPRDGADGKPAENAMFGQADPTADTPPGQAASPLK